MHDGDVAHTPQLTDTQDDRTGGEIGDFGIGERFGEGAVNGIAMGKLVVVEVGGLTWVWLIGCVEALGRGKGGGVGRATGGEITVGEEDAVFVVATHAGGIEREC